MRLSARWLLAASLLLNAAALLAYFSFSRAPTRRFAVATTTPAPARDPSAALSQHFEQLLSEAIFDPNVSRKNRTALLVDLAAAASTIAAASSPPAAAPPPPASSPWSDALGAAAAAARALLLLTPALCGGAACGAAYWQLAAWRRPLALATAASLTLLALAQLGGAGGAGTALWLYALLSLAALLHAVYTSDGIARAVLFWRLVGRMIVHYKLVSWWGAHSDVEAPEVESVYAQLHNTYAPQVLQLILQLRGFYIKLGQVVSVIDLVPQPYRDALAVLQSGVPPKPPEQVHQIIVAELGKPADQLFASFDDVPLGSASIGQAWPYLNASTSSSLFLPRLLPLRTWHNAAAVAVQVHRAKLKDGRDVVVKVQYEEVRRLFATDFSQLQAACYFWTPQALSEMRELRAQFMAEFDFRREGRVMSQIADNLAVPFPRVAVPRPIPGMVSENVLVMTYLPGGSLLDAIKRMAQAYADAQGISVEDLKARLMAEAREGSGGSSSVSDGRHLMKVNLLQAYARSTQLAVNAGVALYNSSIGLFATPKKYREKHQLIEISSTIKQLCTLLGHQVLIDGLFSSDPHPGNLLLLPDGRLGLIDFGQVKRLTKEQRLKVARTVVAVATDDEEAMLKIARASDLRTRNNDPKALVQYVRLMWAGNVKEFAKVAKADPVTQTDGELVMLRRAVVLVRALSAALSGSPVNMAAEWEPMARKLLAEAGGDDASDAEPGIDVGGGIRVWLRQGEGADAKYEAVEVRYEGPLHGTPSLSWVDETELFMWPNKRVRGSTLHPVVTHFGIDALSRVVGCAALGAAAMKEENGFKLQPTPASDDDDDRLQLLRALCYLSWGISSGSMSGKDASPSATGGADHYYVISAGIKSIKLCGPFATLKQSITRSAAIEKQVRKYFPRAFFTRLEQEGRDEVAPLMNGLLDPLKLLLAAPLASDPHGTEVATQLLHNLFGKKLQLERTPSAEASGAAPAASGDALAPSVEEPSLAPVEGRRHESHGSMSAPERPSTSSAAAAAGASSAPIVDPALPRVVAQGEAKGAISPAVARAAAKVAAALAASPSTPPSLAEGGSTQLGSEGNGAVSASSSDVPEAASPKNEAGKTSAATPCSRRSACGGNSPQRPGSTTQPAHTARSTSSPERSHAIGTVPRGLGKASEIPTPSSVPPTRARLECHGAIRGGSRQHSFAGSYTESESAVSDRDFQSAEEGSDEES
ncbi:hypothetical protein AB1Y20_022024 [Prymnesium parvum]|uniref:ABC1 atypical kinase-like domain-containing protein n=1 Tax=Prymnesium parvum TaxID=97485 RepID=A0AB34JH63_PRYPA